MSRIKILLQTLHSTFSVLPDGPNPIFTSTSFVLG
ncbi:uncharacterized protein METZ01_LOCUS104829 [marine metagenome]|uniref:Uncharacterized protein n=1 Tax=marine metagenome TaxID=408172 RepID=A0A381WHI1_9ZZZZ